MDYFGKLLKSAATEGFSVHAWLANFAGKGKISLNVTYPSVLEDRQIEYKVFLTNHNLPSLEEIHVDGPIQEEIEIQVNKQQDWKGASQNWPD